MKFKVEDQGRYEVRGDQLVMMSDKHKSGEAHWISVYEEWKGNRWSRGISDIHKMSAPVGTEMITGLRFQYAGPP